MQNVVPGARARSIARPAVLAVTAALVLAGCGAASTGVPEQVTAPAAATPAAAPPAATVPAPAEPVPAALAPPSSPPAASPAAAPAPPPHITTASLVVGDSITVGSADALRSVLAPGSTVDGKVGRQFSAAPPIVSSWTAAHGGPVVLDLGANGTVSPADVRKILAAAGTRRVVLVGVSVPRSWQDGNNAVLRGAAAQHAPNVVFLDWAAIVRASPGLLGPDHVHPTVHGRSVLAAAVAKALST